MNKLIDFKSLRKIKEDDDSQLVDTTGLSNNPKKNLQSLIKNNKVITKDITKALFQRFSNHRYIINNAYIFSGWESDFITVTESMYLYEIECKMSKSDFKEDFLKTEKHTLLESINEDNKLLTPNKFYYCAPRGLIASYEIPQYAGLMEVSKDKNGELICTTVKEAPFLHKEDVFSTIKDSLLQKLAWRYRDIMLADQNDLINILQSEKH